MNGKLIAQALRAIADAIEADHTEPECFAPEPAPALLDRNQLARELSVSQATIDRLRREGLPTIWLFDAPRFELVAVLAWLKSGRGAG